MPSVKIYGTSTALTLTSSWASGSISEGSGTITFSFDEIPDIATNITATVVATKTSVGNPYGGFASGYPCVGNDALGYTAFTRSSTYTAKLPLSSFSSSVTLKFKHKASVQVDGYTKGSIT